MWATIGQWLAKKFITSEIEKLQGSQKDLAEKAFADFVAGKNLKQEVYQYADGILAEGQGMAADKVNDWFAQKRAELKTWAGQ